MRTVRFRAAAVASGALALGGCGGVDVSSASAPADVSDGSYAYLASSAPGNAPAALLTIDGDTLTLTGEAGAVTTTTGEPAAPSRSARSAWPRPPSSATAARPRRSA